MGIAQAGREAGVFGRMSVWVWLALPVLALWPVWLWNARRLSDGSDDPFGIIALAVLLVSLWRERNALRRSPHLPWLLLSLLLSGLLVSGLVAMPPLVRAALSVTAVLCVVMALRTRGQPMLAWFGLGMLALPIISSLQFFAGYPLRVITAQATAWMLQGSGIDVLRQGAVLEVAGRTVMVDAPCSGIQMGWVAYFTACATAAWLRLPDRSVLRRLPLLGLIVLAGNILRNTLLVLLESGLWAGPAWLHEGIGLAVFVAVCALVLRYMAATDGGSHEDVPDRSIQVGHPAALGVIFLGFLAVAFLSLTAEPTGADARANESIEWPMSFAGQSIRPLALSAVEQRFAEGFPGTIARFTDGERVISMRHVLVATRKLHPAADCYRGLGYRIGAIALERRPDHGMQRCFVASKEGRTLRVCEYIEDAGGAFFTDTSAWYWAAIRGESKGPWRAITVASATGE